MDLQVYKAELTEGDIIVMGSDGLFDNVYDQDIESTLRSFGGSDQESAERSGNSLLYVHFTTLLLLSRVYMPLSMNHWCLSILIQLFDKLSSIIFCTLYVVFNVLYHLHVLIGKKCFD